MARIDGLVLDAPGGKCDLLVTCGTDHGEQWGLRRVARVVSITPPLRAHAHVVDITPARFHSELAEASILAVLERLYDLPETERVLRQKLPRPRRVTATMLKGKRVGVLASPRTSLEIAERLRNWGVTAACTSEEMHAQCDVVVDARACAETEREALGTVVPAFPPSLEVREAATEAVMAFLRSGQSAPTDPRG